MLLVLLPLLLKMTDLSLREVALIAPVTLLVSSRVEFEARSVGF